MSKTEKNQGKRGSLFFAGMMLGSLLGASAALLLTPKTGKDMRTQVDRGTHSIRRKSVDFIQLAKERSSSLAKSVSDKQMIQYVKKSIPGRKNRQNVNLKPSKDVKLTAPKDYI
ncbi:YtxH domain-containing protein [Terrilactibacillus laevilacticus]|uniref:YtxH domain-containing protein n=1 Tax=Terrilactibacillus laevilacticus TaxID=1380157 RepID=A0ABW5PTK5_9BACI|nr:YtxH domain-containing protein [Terrilactibacillus laevilacticus]